MTGVEFGARLADARKGEEAAFAWLFRDIQPALLRYLHVIAPEAADDVAAETWLQVVAGLASFRGNPPSRSPTRLRGPRSPATQTARATRTAPPNGKGHAKAKGHANGKGSANVKGHANAKADGKAKGHASAKHLATRGGPAAQPGTGKPAAAQPGPRGRPGPRETRILARGPAIVTRAAELARVWSL